MLEASAIDWYCAPGPAIRAERNQGRAQSGQDMASHPILTKVLCVALVASIMLPLGRMVFPFVDTVVSGLEFDTLQAVVSATIGFGLHATFFG
jgi:hypothetical protein